MISRFSKFLLAFSVFMMMFTDALADITLQQCRELARDNYPNVKKYGVIDATRECNLRNASMTWLPRVEIGGDFAWVNNTMNLSDILTGNVYDFIEKYLPTVARFFDKEEKSFQYRGYATLTQNVWDGGASSLMKKMALKEAENQKAEIEVSIYSLERQVDEVYFSILLFNSRLEQFQFKISILEENLKKLEKYFEEGIASDADINAVKVEIISAQQAIDMIQSNITSYRLSLSLLTGKGVGEEKLVTPELNNESHSVRPEFELINSQKSFMELQKKKFDVDLMPKIGLFATAYYGYPNRNIFENLQNGYAGFNAQIGGRITFNLSPLYTRKKDRAIVTHKMQMLDIEKDVLKFHTDVQNSFYNQEGKRLELAMEKDKDIYDLRKSLRKSAECKFENGVIDMTELLTKINEESDAALQIDIHRLELLKLRYQIANNETE